MELKNRQLEIVKALVARQCDKMEYEDRQEDDLITGYFGNQDTQETITITLDEILALVLELKNTNTPLTSEGVVVATKTPSKCKFRDGGRRPKSHT